MVAEPIPSSGELQDQGLTPLEPAWKAVWRRFKRNRTAVFGLVVLILLYLMAIFAPVLATQPLEFIDYSQKNRPPSLEHPFGTDQFGRDVWSRIVWGSRTSLTVGFVAAGVAVAVGTLIGGIAGYYGGTWLDIGLMRFAEAVESFPFFFLLIVVVSVVERSLFMIMLVIGLTSWPSLAMLVRGLVLSIRERDFVEASRALGASDRRIMWKHVLPNTVAVIIVSATLRIGYAILAEAGLSFLGFGPPPPTASWGKDIALGREVLRQAWWVATFPGLFITLTVLAFNFVGDGLRDALDPKMKR
ncbi:MAG: ABC transporter permease [Bacillota bacterium]|nr:MAG: peptide ABC transporter permease [Bacillota bacterium]